MSPSPPSSPSPSCRFSGDIESGNVQPSFKVSDKWWLTLHLAYQSLGIVYGDIGTSPLYVYSSTLTSKIKHNDDILGVLSLIFYTITLVPILKYVFLVLHATDNNSDGGTCALYSLICRHAEVGLMPTEHAEDRDSSQLKNKVSRLRSMLENSKSAKHFLLFATVLGASLVIGDGILTPCISVMSAVGGIKKFTPGMTQDAIAWISVTILVCLFIIQRFGTDKVGDSFAPIICIWFILIAGIGLYNLIMFDPTVVRAINPMYIIDYLRRNNVEAWISLGGIVLAITGTEALYADVGHFSVRSIQLSMCFVTYPSLILAYTGQASFLRKHNNLVADTFYKSIPQPLYWPMFVMAVLAAIIASQAMISGTFSIIQQSMSIGCFPPVKVIHTSSKYKGQVYIPEVNYFLMFACVAVTLGFRSTTAIANAYGIAMMFVMILTSLFLLLIMVMIWKTNKLIIISYVFVIGSLEFLYLSSVMYKFNQGGYLPLAMALLTMTVMFIWNYVHRRKYFCELHHRISHEKVKEIIEAESFCRIPGLAMFYSEQVHGIPPIFKHYAEISALHSVIILVSIESLPVSKVLPERRFLFHRVEPRELNMFRCIVRRGYMDNLNEPEPLERMLIEKLKEFIRDSHSDYEAQVHDNDNEYSSEADLVIEENNDGESEADLISEKHNNRESEGDDLITEENNSGDSEDGLIVKEHNNEALEGEIEMINRACQAGIVHLIGESEVVAAEGAGLFKRLLIDLYTFLKKNARQTDTLLYIPHKRMLKVGMTYEL